MRPTNRWICAAIVLVFATACGPVAAQTDEDPSCIYDPELDAFRAYDAAADVALERETLDPDGPAAPEMVMVGGLRYRKAEDLRGTVEILNELVVSREIVDGIRYFGTTDPHGDIVVAQHMPNVCLSVAFRYAPELVAAWIMERPFVFTFPALAVDASSFRRDGDHAYGAGFLMFGHPHGDSAQLYYRQRIETDCAGARTRVIDTRAYRAGGVLSQRYGGEPDWTANDDLDHPATRMLAHFACNVPETWPQVAFLKDGIDKFSELVHQAAHAQP